MSSQLPPIEVVVTWMYSDLSKNEKKKYSLTPATVTLECLPHLQRLLKKFVLKVLYELELAPRCDYAT